MQEITPTSQNSKILTKKPVTILYHPDDDHENDDYQVYENREFTLDPSVFQSKWKRVRKTKEERMEVVEKRLEFYKNLKTEPRARYNLNRDQVSHKQRRLEKAISTYQVEQRALTKSKN